MVDAPGYLGDECDSGWADDRRAVGGDRGETASGLGKSGGPHCRFDSTQGYSTGGQAKIPQEGVEILLGMLDQRRRLGLAPANFEPEIKSPIEVVPIVAIGRGYSAATISGMRQVNRRLDEKGLNSPPLRAFEVTSIGRLYPEIELQCEPG